MNASSLYDTAHSLLDAAVDSYVGQPNDVPNTRYVHQGQPAMDTVSESCSMLVVSVGQILRGFVNTDATGFPSRQGPVPLSASLDVWVIRCVPSSDESGEPPSATALDDSARELLADGLILVSGIQERWARREIIGCRTLELVGAQAYGPQGGVGGWSCSYTATLP